MLDDSGGEQPAAERPLPPKSGAAAAAAVAAAKADVAAREVARRTWKDPLAAAREQGQSTSAANTSGATGVNGDAASGEGVAEGKIGDVPAGVKEEAGAGGAGRGEKDGGAGVANGNGAMKRKRTRSGMVVDCEEI